MAAAQTLFVGNLSFFSTEQDVQALFSRFGPLLSVKIRRGKSGDHLQHGFITVPAEFAPIMIHSLNDFKFMGRRIRVNFATGESAKLVSRGRSEWVQIHVSFITQLIRFQINEEMLDSVFGRFGAVADVSIKQYTISMYPPKQSGYGFVYFESPDAAFNAITTLKKASLDGVQYDCNTSFEPGDNTKRMNNARAPPPPPLRKSTSAALMYGSGNDSNDEFALSMAGLRISNDGPGLLGFAGTQDFSSKAQQFPPRVSSYSSRSPTMFFPQSYQHQRSYSNGCEAGPPRNHYQGGAPTMFEFEPSFGSQYQPQQQQYGASLSYHRAAREMDQQHFEPQQYPPPPASYSQQPDLVSSLVSSAHRSFLPDPLLIPEIHLQSPALQSGSLLSSPQFFLSNRISHSVSSLDPKVAISPSTSLPVSSMLDDCLDTFNRQVDLLEKNSAMQGGLNGGEYLLKTATNSSRTPSAEGFLLEGQPIHLSPTFGSSPVHVSPLIELYACNIDATSSSTVVHKDYTSLSSFLEALVGEAM